MATTFKIFTSKKKKKKKKSALIRGLNFKSGYCMDGPGDIINWYRPLGDFVIDILINCRGMNDTYTSSPKPWFKGCYNIIQSSLKDLLCFWFWGSMAQLLFSPLIRRCVLSFLFSTKPSSIPWVSTPFVSFACLQLGVSNHLMYTSTAAPRSIKKAMMEHNVLWSTDRLVWLIVCFLLFGFIENDSSMLFVYDSFRRPYNKHTVTMCLKSWSHECRIVPHRPTHEKRMTFKDADTRCLLLTGRKAISC